MRLALIIPTRNAAAHLDRLLPALAAQTLQPDEFLVVDSASRDDSVVRFRDAGARVDADVLIYLTQDAIPASPETFARIVSDLQSEPDIGVAYGRQLPHPHAGLLGAQSRRFNYPPVSRTKRLRDASELGIKTCFSSDSFAAYRREALCTVGGFPEDVIGSEDAY